MKRKPFFSIIIPTLNEEKYLPSLLADLARQTYQDFEVIVVDGHSDDKTVTEAQKFEKELPLLKIISTPKRSASFQRNLGAKNAQGKALLFLDADSRLPDYFLIGIKYRFDSAKPDLFTSYLKPDTQRISDKAVAQVINFATDTANKVTEKPTAIGAFMGFRLPVFQKIKGFNERITYAEDSEIVRRAVKKGFRYQVFKDPRFILSFRRFRKEGTLQSLRKYSRLVLKVFKEKEIKAISVDYPMGGNYYDQIKEKIPLSQKMRKIYQKILEIVFSS